MDLSQCEEIYREAFGDDGEFQAALFSTCGKYCKTVSESGRVCSFLFALPCDILLDKKTIRAYYIYAAATKKEYRGRGHMSRLVEDIARDGRLLFLKPADEKLFGFYRKLGFSEFCVTDNLGIENRAVPTGDFAKLTKAFSLENPVCTQAMYKAFAYTELKSIYFPYIME